MSSLIPLISASSKKPRGLLIRGFTRRSPMNAPVARKSPATMLVALLHESAQAGEYRHGVTHEILIADPVKRLMPRAKMVENAYRIPPASARDLERLPRARHFRTDARSPIAQYEDHRNGAQ